MSVVYRRDHLISEAIGSLLSSFQMLVLGIINYPVKEASSL